MRQGPAIAPWTNQELAELYRIVDLLAKAGMSVETESGMSDEGDPWFVFTQPDTGDVIAHFARIDGEFVAAASHTGKALRGRSFREVVDNIIDGQPLVFPRPKVDADGRGDEKSSNVVRLYLHPAVVLTAFVATALLHTRKALAVDNDGNPSSSRTGAENNGRPTAGRAETSAVSSEAAAVAQGNSLATGGNTLAAANSSASFHQTNVMASALAIVVATVQSDSSSQDFLTRLAVKAEADTAENGPVVFDEPPVDDQGPPQATITDGPHAFDKIGALSADGGPKIMPTLPVGAQIEGGPAIEAMTTTDTPFLMVNASEHQNEFEPNGGVDTISTGSDKALASEQIAALAVSVDEADPDESSASTGADKASSETVDEPNSSLNTTANAESTASDDTLSSSSFTMQVSDDLLLRFGGVTVDDTEAFALSLVQFDESAGDSDSVTDYDTASDNEDDDALEGATGTSGDMEDQELDIPPVTYVDAGTRRVELSDGADRLFFSGGTLEVINWQPGVDTILISEELMDGDEYAGQTGDGTIVIHFSEGSSITLVGLQMSDLLA